MGSYLGKSGPPPLSPGEGRTDVPRRPVIRRPVQSLHQVHRVQYVHRAHPAPRFRPWRRQPSWGPARPTGWVVSEAWRRFPGRRPQNPIVGPLPSALWESYWNFRIWPPRPRAAWSPVTIKIAPPEPRGVPSKSPARVSSAESSPSEKPSDPCAKETVLRALRECRKGRVRRQEPLLPEWKNSEGSPDAKPSAFKPLTQNEVSTSLVPRPGSLKRSLDSGSSDHSLHKRPCCSSVSSWASTEIGGLCGSKKNAIISSYSSSRDLSKHYKRSVPSASFQMPEWPVKKRVNGHQCHSPVPLVSEKSPAAAGHAGQQNQETPRLLSSPRTLPSLTPLPQLGYAAPKEDLGSEKAGLQKGNKPRKDATEVTTASVPDSQPPVPRCWVLLLPPAGAVPTQDTNPQVGSPGPLAFPQPAGENSRMARPPPKTPSLLAPLRCSWSEPLPGPCLDAKPTAAVTLLTSASPTSPATDTTQPPATSQADRSARPPDPPAITPAAPSIQRALFGKRREPAAHHPASASPATPSADPTVKCVWGSPPNGEAGVASHSRVSATAVASPPPGIVIPTFKPIFGDTGPLTTLPVRAPLSFRPVFPPVPPAAALLPHGLLKATSAVMSTAPASTSKDSSFKPPVGCNAVAVTSAMGNTPSLPSAGHASLLGAAQAGAASFSPAAGFTVPSHQCPTTPTAYRVPSFSQALPSAVQVSPSRNTANLRGMGSPLQASALVTANQLALSSGVSNPTSTFTVPWGSSSKPPSPLPLGVTPLPAFGASGDQKQRAPQAALGPSFNSSFIFGNSAMPPPTPAPVPTPAQQAFGSLTQPAFGASMPSASNFHPRPGFGSTPAGFSFGQASATGFGVVTQAFQSGACGSVFGRTAPRPFAFGGLEIPMDCEESGVSMTLPDKSSNSGMFSVGAMLGGATRPTIIPFGKVCHQSTQGLTSHITPFASGRASISARKTVFRAPHMVPLAQSTPVPGPVKIGSSFSFGVPSPHAQSSVGRGSFRSSAPSFSFSAKPKTPKKREHGHSRRHHAHRR
ncbi:PREDICTED: POM121-like protein 2 [Hipposideros armiger]|uniref:POM121-like protein 2 n=1 Tax=Hipposideros armiger TaxID=186990 RepID=A0A8B7QGH0_HIPAR|nr:PREDICTED: POM121-like protein 2 [Hipposideros armiger]